MLWARFPAMRKTEWGPPVTFKFKVILSLVELRSSLSYIRPYLKDKTKQKHKEDIQVTES